MERFFTCSPSEAATGGPAAGRSRKHKTVDIHCHVLVPQADELVKPVFTPDKEAAFRFANQMTREINRKQRQDMHGRLTDAATRLADMDRLGIDIQAISPAPNQYFYWADPDLGRQTSRLINTRLAELASQHTDRFVALGTVPLQQPELAVAELRHCMRNLGMKGVEISSNVDGRELSDPELAPFFAAAEELDALIFMHPLGFTQGERLTDHYLNNVIGNPLESAIALAHLIFEGVLERHSGLKLCVAHGGGFLPTYAGRMEHAYHARSDCRCHIHKPPSEYLRRLYFDTVVFDPKQLAFMVEQYGADKIVMGTDYPYDMAEADPVAFVNSVEGLTESDIGAILGGNALRLLNL